MLDFMMAKRCLDRRLVERRWWGLEGLADGAERGKEKGPQLKNWRGKGQTMYPTRGCAENVVIV
jgi:hypothetical protein